MPIARAVRITRSAISPRLATSNFSIITGSLRWPRSCARRDATPFDAAARATHGDATMFLTLMVVGLAGLVAMALPALGRHGALGHGGASHALHGGASVRGVLHAGASVGKLAQARGAATALVAAKPG